MLARHLFFSRSMLGKVEVQRPAHLILVGRLRLLELDRTANFDADFPV